MRGVVGVVHTISDSLVGDMEEGDPPTNVVFPQMTLMLAKSNETGLSNATFQTEQGSLKLPNINVLLNKTEEFDEFGTKITTCYDRQVCY